MFEIVGSGRVLCSLFKQSSCCEMVNGIVSNSVGLADGLSQAPVEGPLRVDPLLLEWQLLVSTLYST